MWHATVVPLLLLVITMDQVQSDMDFGCYQEALKNVSKAICELLVRSIATILQLSIPVGM